MAKGVDRARAEGPNGCAGIEAAYTPGAGARVSRGTKQKGGRYSGLVAAASQSAARARAA